MVSATPPPNPDPENPKNVYHIGGIQVEFPYQPYGSQLAFMGRVISTLDRAHREGRCHALLESPTGTGKTLSLLCSSLAWQQNCKLKNQYANPSHLNPAPEAVTDPLAYGGGFVPVVEPSGNPGSENLEPAQSAAKHKNQTKKATPTIYYASKLLLSDRERGCPEFKNVHKVKGHPSLQKGGCHEAHDIEDLVKVGQAVKGCSYYAARSMADDAQLVFCPYNYILNPVIRGAMEVDVKGAIVILDEAHNIEDIARDAGSVDVEEDILHKLQAELEQLCMGDVLTYQPLYEMTQDLINWIERRKSTLEKREFQHHVSCWTGDKALRELQEANISQQCFPILLECAAKAIKAASDTESDIAHLSGMSVMTLEGFFSSLTYFFSRNGCHIFDYQLALQRYVKKNAGKVGNWTHTLSLWCLNPAVVFRDIADLSLSVVLTSGTLSPMSSFSSELGVQFGTCLEAPHVIDVESQLCSYKLSTSSLQVWPAIISTGPGNYPLNASYKTADTYAFQDALGKSLEEIFRIVPGGCLVFFPSYKLMEKLCNRWCETGQWSQLNAKKSLSVEPRGGSQDDFETVLKGYYDSIVSEGIDFSDDNARVVIIVGIPFPNIHDIQVALKKKYNDTHKSSKILLSGNEWYCQQAFRALNQAAGRCIRHRFDYGAIILLAFPNVVFNQSLTSKVIVFCKQMSGIGKKGNRAYISKWLRKPIRQYDSFEVSIEGLKSFFKDVKDRIGKSTLNVLQNFDITKETRSEALSMAFTHDNPEVSIVRETPCTTASAGSSCKDDNSCSTLIQASTEFRHQVLVPSTCLSNSGKALSETLCSVAVTPEKNITTNTYSLMPEVESSLNLSVNSHAQKRRKFLECPHIDLAQDEQSDVSPTKTPVCTSLTRSSIADSDAIAELNLVSRQIMQYTNPKNQINTSNPLGVQVVATDVSNIQLLDKILLYFECLEIKNLEASRDKVLKETKPVSGSGMEKIAILNSIDKFSYGTEENSGGWRTTKSKLRLPKKGLFSSGEA
ncbi:hypothetical protein CJ030_MR8G015346 [Morella rubra]|uniref:Regulator of telomere elongation helicase 1 homolog n=1 Tax=Morella rubra TaxID=262757 RepID=A0A6A1UT82_9ROSI|nr:hypothetical protein CJ030_MR8G015346 [Morella rubra]